MLISHFAIRGNEVIPMKYIGKIGAVRSSNDLFEMTKPFMQYQAGVLVDESMIIAAGYSIR